jgi:hypothetical protein
MEQEVSIADQDFMYCVACGHAKNQHMSAASGGGCAFFADVTLEALSFALTHGLPGAPAQALATCRCRYYVASASDFDEEQD